MTPVPRFEAGLPAVLFALVMNAVAVAEDAVPVAIRTVVQAQVFEEVPLTATVTAPRVSSLSPRVDGLVAAVQVDDGDRVRAGDELVRLDDELARIALRRAVAAVGEAKARLAEAERQRSEAEELVRKKHVPATQYEARVADVNIAAAAVERLRAEEAQVREEIARHVVHAPFDGVVADKLTDVGEWVDTGTALLELVETERLRLEVPVPQAYYARVTAGTSVQLRFDSRRDETVTAELTRIVPVTNPNARTFTAHIDIDNPQERLTPGMSARVTLRLGDADAPAGLLVPRDAVVAKPDGTTLVWKLIDSDGRPVAEPVRVRIGRAWRDSLEILDGGLDTGDRVIVRGNERLQAGQAVLIKDAS